MAAITTAQCGAVEAEPSCQNDERGEENSEVQDVEQNDELRLAGCLDRRSCYAREGVYQREHGEDLEWRYGRLPPLAEEADDDRLGRDEDANPHGQREKRHAPDVRQEHFSECGLIVLEGGVGREHDAADDVADPSRGQVGEAPGHVVVADVCRSKDAPHGGGVEIRVEEVDDVGGRDMPSEPAELAQDAEAEEARGRPQGRHHPECDRLDRLPRELACDEAPDSKSLDREGDRNERLHDRPAELAFCATCEDELPLDHRSRHETQSADDEDQRQHPEDIGQAWLPKTCASHGASAKATP